jgi:predicted glycogen debranching enzyme
MSDAHVHRPAWVGQPGPAARPLLENEWLVTNALGGYASSTVGNVMTRKYHGYLVASLPAPHGRVVTLQNLHATLRLADGREIVLSGEERLSAGVTLPSERFLWDFRLELGLPVWEYEIEGVRLRKQVILPHQQNTVYITYQRVDAGEPLVLLLRPFVHVRSHESEVTTPRPLHRITVEGERLELETQEGMEPLRLHTIGSRAAFSADAASVGELAYRVERDRGYAWVGEGWSPGTYALSLQSDESASLVASTEAWALFESVSAEDADTAERLRRRRLLELAGTASSDMPGELLTLAADQFIITPRGRLDEIARAAAAGDEARTVIAGYHWFTDWGRDTMISLEGLTLATGRHREAGYILRTFAQHVRDGLIPNMFPDGASEGLYHTADATLWFFHAVHRYVQTTGDRLTLRAILPVLREIVARHVEGTRFGIRVDPADGLLMQGAAGYQLTWMDAKVDGWVVTPRRGKAVEINALWYNALRLLEEHLLEEGDVAEAARLDQLATRVRTSFNRRFWNEKVGYLYDVVDGEGMDVDPACRPNQIFAISLDRPVLEASRWRPVLETVHAKLLTPVGLRSLAPDHPDFKSRYFGDLRARDAAYHQGTVWGWLIGPFIDAWLRVYPEDSAGARALLLGLIAHIDYYGVGSIAEIFDAEPPYTPRGCIAQAWSVAETFRAWRKTEKDP